MAKDLSNWLPKQDMARLLGITERQVERLAKEQKIRRGYQRVPGRRPLPVFHPTDIEELRQETLPPIPDNGKSKKSATLPVPLNRSTANILAALGMVNGARVALKDKFYLTMREAAELSGLPKNYLPRLVKEGSLPALRAGGYRIRRSDLEQL